MFSSPLDKKQGNRSLDHMVKEYLVLLQFAKLSSKWLYHFACPLVANQSSCCSTSSVTFSAISDLDFGHCNMYRVIVHCYHLYFPDDIWCRVSFSYSLVTCISSLMRYQLRSLTKFIIRSFFLLLSFKSSFYILCNFIRCFFYKYILPAFDLSSHSLDIVFCRAVYFNED